MSGYALRASSLAVLMVKMGARDERPRGPNTAVHQVFTMREAAQGPDGPKKEQKQRDRGPRTAQLRELESAT